MSLPERIACFPVVLRGLDPADAPRVAELCGDWEVARMTALIPHPYRLEMAESFIDACRATSTDGPACTYAITRAEGGLLVGAIGITSSVDAGDSLGYWIGRPYWGRGYATAAARAVIALAFSRLDVDVLSAIHLVQNPGSGRVMAKCGMSEMRRETRPHRDGAPEEFLVWTIDRDAWARTVRESG